MFLYCGSVTLTYRFTQDGFFHTKKSADIMLITPLINIRTYKQHTNRLILHIRQMYTRVKHIKDRKAYEEKAKRV